MLNSKFLWPRWDIIYRDLARVTEGMSFWNRFFVKTWFGWAFAFLGLVGMFSLIILSFFYFYSYFYEFSLFEMKRSFFMDQFVCTVVFLEQFIKYIYIYLLEIIRDYFIVLDFWYFMGQILSRVIFIYQIYFDVIFLFLSTEWYVSFISLPYDNFLELYYYLSQWKDYDMNILRIVNEMDSYAFSQFSYIALEYITFYYQNHWDAHRYVSRGYTYQDYLNYKSMEILDIRNKYVSYLDVLEDWAIADPENEMFRRLKAVTYQFDIQLRQRAWLFEFDEAFKELRDLFKDPELIALVKEVSPEAANFLLLLGDEIWRISSYLRWPLFRWLLYQNDLLERFRTEEGKFLARDKRLLMWFLEFFEYVDYLYSKRYKFAWIELIRMTQLEYWQKWDYSELIWRYMMFLSKQDEMWKDRFNFLLLLNDNPITGEDFVSNKWYKKLNKSLVDARNSTTYFAFYNPNVALIFYRISTLVNDLYTKTVEAKTAIDKDRSLNWLIRGITYPDVPLRFLVKYSDFNINLFSSVFDFYLLCFFKLFRNFIFYNIYDFLKFVYFNVIDEISIFIEIFRESYPTHNLID